MKKALIVDDSATIRNFINRDLKKSKRFLFKGASSGAEALTILDQYYPDVITLDIEMPDMNGFEVCEKIRKHPNQKVRQAPIIFLTSKDSTEQRNMGYRKGGNDFINKPFLEGEILQSIEKLLDRKNSFHETHVVIADDSQFIRIHIQNTLEQNGVFVKSFENGQLAAEYLKDNYQKVDLVITDYVMPELDGIGLCKFIRQNLGCTDVPIIFITSSDTNLNMIYEIGASDYINKSALTRELIARTEAHLKTRKLQCELRKKIAQSKKLSRKLEEQKKEMEEDITLAAELQQYMFESRPKLPYLNTSVYFKSCSMVSGDIYSFISNSKKECLMFLGDATGHGVAAALTTMMAHTLLNQDSDSKSMKEIISNMNEEFEKNTPNDRFMSASLVKIKPDGSFEAVNAGHSELFLVNSEKAEIILIKPEGALLGVLPKDIAEYEVYTGQLQKGERLFVYSDGVTELSSKDKTMYGIDNLQNFILFNSELSLEKFPEQLDEELQHFSKGCPWNDDVTFIGLEFLG